MKQQQKIGLLCENKIGACFKLENCLGALPSIPVCTLYAAVCIWLITNSVQLPMKKSFSFINLHMCPTNKRTDISNNWYTNKNESECRNTAELGHSSQQQWIFKLYLILHVCFCIYLNRLNPKNKNTVKRRIHSVAHCGSITEKLSKWKLDFISIHFTCCWCFITTLWASIHPWRVCDKRFSSYSSK